VVAHFSSDGHLQVMGLGVGTKFLAEDVIREDETNSYGTRVRDCHAEVLARRAFRRQLSLELKMLSRARSENESNLESYRPIMRHACNGTDFDLVDDVTLHFYTSSAPCGNATLKKFTKMERETYKDELGPNEWPEANHDAMPGHSLKHGQFHLLIKKDTKSAAVEQLDKSQTQISSDIPQPRPPQKGKMWPANQSDDWCPPGTSIVAFQKGSLHTCSDKICRWNCLGLPGSLLASILKAPLYMSTITVGRKLNANICRRAICCRAERATGKRQETTSETQVTKYSLHHPTVMGTGVYMDDVGKAKQNCERDGWTAFARVSQRECHYLYTGVIDMTDAHTRDQDVRFDSTLAWVWWPFIGDDRDFTGGSCFAMAECIDGTTGLTRDYFEKHSDKGHVVSLVSTVELVRLFSSLSGQTSAMLLESPKTLTCLRAFKRDASPEYETAKDTLLSKDGIFRQWRRREKVS
jgi:hypothetical protein